MFGSTGAWTRSTRLRRSVRSSRRPGPRSAPSTKPARTQPPWTQPPGSQSPRDPVTLNPGTLKPVALKPVALNPATPDPATPDPVTPDPATLKLVAPADVDGRDTPWELVRRTQAGDAEAFGQLYDRYIDLVYRFIYYRLGDRTQAEDLTSETFLRALHRIATVHEQGRDIGAWLITIARNLVLDHVKSAAYRLSITTDEIFERHTDDTTEAGVFAMADQRMLFDAVRQLSAEQQESIVLRYFQGLSLSETAEVMGRNAGAVKALQHRGLNRLRALLEHARAVDAEPAVAPPTLRAASPATRGPPSRSQALPTPRRR